MSTLPPNGPDYGQTPPGSGGAGGYGGYGGNYGGGYGGGAGEPSMPPMPGGGWAVGDALAYGWKKFVENLGQIVLAALVLFAAVIVAAVLGFVVREVIVTDAGCELRNGVLACSTGPSWITSQLVLAIQQFIASAVMMIVTAMLLRGALDITEGRPFQLSGTLARINIGAVVVAGLIISLITAVGYALLWLPGVIATFVFLFTPFFVIDKKLDGVAAITESLKFTRDNLGNLLVWFVIGGLVALLGFCLCGVGALVTMPVVLIGAAYTFKKLTGQPVAP